MGRAGKGRVLEEGGLSSPPDTNMCTKPAKVTLSFVHLRATIVVVISSRKEMFFSLGDADAQEAAMTRPMILPKRPRTRRIWLRLLGTVFAASIAAALLWLGYVGAFGGTLYADLPAKGPAATARQDVAAVIFSGDMGFNIGMAPKIAARLAAAGISVTGVNSLVHFRTRRTPAEVRAYIEDAMHHARATMGARRLILIGQSYGADMLPVGLAALPQAERDRIALVALVVPTDTLYFRISPAEMFEWSTPDADALPTARMLNWVPVLCLRGAAETRSLCPLLRTPNVEHVALPGGHLLRLDDAAVAAQLLGKIRRTLNADTD